MKDEQTAIRTAATDDSAELARLSAELGYAVSEEEIRQRVADIGPTANRLLAVACRAGPGLLGWIEAERRLSLVSGERVEITGLVVDSTARRRGIGKALVSHIEAWASSMRVPSVTVRSNVLRESAHRFYTGLGYVCTKTQDRYAKLVKIAGSNVT